MVSASPSESSDRLEARCGLNDRPATEQNELWSRSAAERRACNGDDAGMGKCGEKEPASLPSLRYAWVARRKRPQILTSPPGSRHTPT